MQEKGRGGSLFIHVAMKRLNESSHIVVLNLRQQTEQSILLFLHHVLKCYGNITASLKSHHRSSIHQWISLRGDSVGVGLQIPIPSEYLHPINTFEKSYSLKTSWTVKRKNQSVCCMIFLFSLCTMAMCPVLFLGIMALNFWNSYIQVPTQGPPVSFQSQFSFV